LNFKTLAKVTEYSYFVAVNRIPQCLLKTLKRIRNNSRESV